MRVIMCALMLLVAGQLSTHAQEAGFIEPQAGPWKTWVIASGTQFRAPPPPDAAGAASEVLAYIFPERGEFFRKLADEAGRSLLIAGVNYASDVDAGMALGRQVAVRVIARGKLDRTDAKWTGSMT